MKIAIVGYGRLGKGVYEVLTEFKGVELYGIFSRRKSPSGVPEGVSVYPTAELMTDKHIGKIDCIINATASKSDLLELTPKLLERFCVVDSFDIHKKIPEHIKNCDKVAKGAKTAALISCGWDPGLFSLIRSLSASFMPNATLNTFWGRGLSQGHSEALRTIDGVEDAVQYTVPLRRSVHRAMRGIGLCDFERVRRICYVSAKRENRKKIRERIRELDGYFSGYITRIHFVGQKAIDKMHKSMAHRGRVISASMGEESFDFSLKATSNPRLTARILLACARAVWRMNARENHGAFTMLDIPPSYYIFEEKYQYM
ncbi:MAG: diaminopimelate dehydrogenase [Clostridia bacterium]|nr:diaminopimelate dehydrogenase [Clostridia bacterium]